MSNTHEMARVLAPSMERRGLLYCPWREQFVVRPPPETLQAWRDRYKLEFLNPTTHLPRPEQRNFLEQFFRDRSDNFLLQAAPGEGKTFTALFAASQYLTQGERVFFAVTTRDLLQQVSDEARTVLRNPFDGPPDDFMAVLSGNGGIKKRLAAYSDPRKRLFVILAPSLANDLEKGRLALDSMGLLVQDEGDLRRGNEAHARINRLWKAAAVRPRGIIMSATLTITHNPTETDWEVTELRESTGFERFYNVPAPSALNYSVNDTSRVQLSDPRSGELSLPARSAIQLRSEFRRLISSLSGDAIAGSNGTDERLDSLRSVILKDSVERDGYHLLPSVTKVTAVLELLKGINPREYKWEARKQIGDQIRRAAAALELFHLHQVLTTELRVSFLEHGGKLLFQARTGAPKPHLSLIFPPGVPPPWWSSLAKGTPYDGLAAVTARSLGPFQSFNADGTPQSHQEFFAEFFASTRSLGSAALKLLESNTHDHPKLRQIAAWSQGQLRKSDSGQLMVYCSSAVEAMYAKLYLGKLLRETTGILVGHSHTNQNDRSINFGKASDGTASLLTATSVAQRGVNLLKLTYLLVLNVPTDLREVKQLFGRVGRDPLNPGTVVLMTTEGCADARRYAVLKAKCKRYGNSSPLRYEIRKPDRFRGPSLFDQV